MKAPRRAPPEAGDLLAGDDHDFVVNLYLALLRRLALNLAKLEGSKGSTKGKLKRAGWDNAFLTRLIVQFGQTHMR